MPVIVENQGKKNECMMAFSSGRIEKIRINTGSYCWDVDLERGTVTMLNMPVDINKEGAQEIRRALLQFDEYLKKEEASES